MPLDEGRVGYGQVAWTSGRGDYCFAVFEEVYPRQDHVRIDDVVRGRLAFLARSMDALLLDNRWQVVGHSPVDETTYPLPAYKAWLAPPGVFEVSDFMDEQRRRGTPDEARQLPPRIDVSPMVVEDALRAFHGLEAWLETYDALRPVPTSLSSAALFPTSSLSRTEEESDASADEQAVITHLPLSGEDYGEDEERASLRELEACIRDAAKRIGADHDGHELGGGEAVLFSYGPSADELFEVIEQCLEVFPTTPGAYAVKRYGAVDDPEAREERVPLS